MGLNKGIVYDALDNIEYRDWDIEAGPIGLPDAEWLRVSFMADGEKQYGRKWRLSQHMTKSEIVQTAFKAILTAEEHEVREKFLYRGHAIFGPHLNVDALVGFSQLALDARPKKKEEKS